MSDVDNYNPSYDRRFRYNTKYLYSYTNPVVFKEKFNARQFYSFRIFFTKIFPNSRIEHLKKKKNTYLAGITFSFKKTVPFRECLNEIEILHI